MSVGRGRGGGREGRKVGRDGATRGEVLYGCSLAIGAGVLSFDSMKLRE